jgi:hypothetical protein
MWKIEIDRVLADRLVKFVPCPCQFGGEPQLDHLRHAVDRRAGLAAYVGQVTGT